jgi:hypothetical protein
MGKNLKEVVVMVYLKVILWNFAAERIKSYGNHAEKIQTAYKWECYRSK